MIQEFTIGDKINIKNSGITYQVVKVILSSDMKTVYYGVKSIDDGLYIKDTEINYQEKKIKDLEIESVQRSRTESLEKYCTEICEYRNYGGDFCESCSIPGEIVKFSVLGNKYKFKDTRDGKIYDVPLISIFKSIEKDKFFYLFSIDDITQGFYGDDLELLDVSEGNFIYRGNIEKCGYCIFTEKCEKCTYQDIKSLYV